MIVLNPLASNTWVFSSVGFRQSDMWQTKVFEFSLYLHLVWVADQKFHKIASGYALRLLLLLFVLLWRQERSVFIAAKLCAETPSLLLIKFTWALPCFISDNCPQSRQSCRNPSRRSPKWTNVCLWRMKSCSGSLTMVIWAARARFPLPRPSLSSHHGTLGSSPALPSRPDNSGLQLPGSTFIQDGALPACWSWSGPCQWLLKWNKLSCTD